jgi:NACHT domain
MRRSEATARWGAERRAMDDDTRVADNGIPGEIASSLDHFTAREWAYDAIDTWAQSGAGGLHVVGGPGSGKSLLLAELIRRRRDGQSGSAALEILTGWHFCRANDDTTILPHRVVAAWASHLAKLPGYLEALRETEPAVAAVITSVITVHGDVAAGAVVVGNQVHLVDSSPERQFDCVIRSPLQAMAANGALPSDVLLVIDGLDEALTIPDGTDLIRLLKRLLAPGGALPQGLRLIITSRPDERITLALRIPRLSLDDTEKSASDITLYARHRLGTVLDDAAATTLAARLADAAQSNFLYARYVVDDLLAEPGRLLAQDPATRPLPEGLAGYYAESLDRELADGEPWSRRYRRLLGALVVARGSGFTADELAGITALPRSEVDDALATCTAYLIGSRREPYRIFHKSFSDYLAADHEHTVYPDEAHGAVARWLAGAGGERAERDLVWHLALAGDLPTLDEHVVSASLLQKESKFGGAAVVEDLNACAAAAARARDLRRTLRWSWASVEFRRHTIEAASAGAIPLVARISGLDAAVKVTESLDAEDSGYERALVELGIQLVDAGRPEEAMALVERPEVKGSSVRPLVAVAARLAGNRPDLALRIAREVPAWERAPLCAALAAAGDEYVAEAEALAGHDADALHAIAVAVGRRDVARAVTIAARIVPRSAQAAGNRVTRGRATACTDIVVERAEQDPAAAAALLVRLLADRSLSGDDVNRAVLAVALRWGPENPDGALSLLDVTEPDGTPIRLNETVRGLMHAAAAAGWAPADAGPVWHPDRSCVVDHTSDADILIGLRLDGLRATPASRAIAREALIHSADRIVSERDEFEYPGPGAGELARAVAVVAPEDAAGVIDRVLAAQTIHNVSESDVAKLRVVPALAVIDTERALELAHSAQGYYQHLALVDLVAALAPVSIARALAVVDRIPAQRSSTRAALLSSCARFVDPDDVGALTALRARLPRVGDSASFHVLFAAVGTSLAARAVGGPEPAAVLAELCAAGLAEQPALRDVLVVARARHLARRAPVDALALSQTAEGEYGRVRGAIEVLRAGDFSPAAVAEEVEQHVSPVLNTRGWALNAELAELVVDVARTDPDAAVAISDQFVSRIGAFHRAAGRISESALARWGVVEGVGRSLAMCMDGHGPDVARERIMAMFNSSGPEVAAQVLAELSARSPHASVVMTPWARAQVDPDSALAACEQLYSDREYMSAQVVRRGWRQGISKSVDLYLRLADRSPDDGRLERALSAAVEAAATADPIGTLAELQNHPRLNGALGDHCLRAFAKGAATSNLELALSAMERIGAAAGGGSDAFAALASGIDFGADRSGDDGPLVRVLELVDRLTKWERQYALKEVTAAAAECPHPSPAQVIRLLRSLAARDADTFDLCLPDVVSASYAAAPGQLAALVDELVVVHGLVVSG